jgi:hypothetical protein
LSSPQRRKVVTLLFSDLVGSTALGERLDPEALIRTASITALSNIPKQQRAEFGDVGITREF